MTTRSRVPSAIATLGVVALIAVSALIMIDAHSGNAPPTGVGHAYFDQAPGASATSFARSEIAGGGRCGSAAHAASTDPVPAPYRWCTYGSAVEYAPRNSQIGLWYQEYSGLPQAPQVCVKYLGRHWWAMTSEDSQDVAQPCPSHYTLTGGG